MARKPHNLKRWTSAPLSEPEQDRLSQLTAKRLFQGPLESAENVERERLRLRKLNTK